MKRISKIELQNVLQKHKLWLEGKTDGECADLSETDLRGMKLPGADLSGADLSNADLRGVDLRGAKLNKVDFYCSDLQGAKLECADLSEAYFKKASLRRAKLRGAKAEKTCFIWTDLSKADLRGIDLSNAELFESNLRGTKLRGAKAEKTCFIWTDLSKADLRWTDLSKADLRGTKLRGTTLQGAKAEREVLSDEQPKEEYIKDRIKASKYGSQYEELMQREWKNGNCPKQLLTIVSYFAQSISKNKSQSEIARMIVDILANDKEDINFKTDRLTEQVNAYLKDEKENQLQLHLAKNHERTETQNNDLTLER